MTTAAVLEALEITRPVLQRLIDTGVLVPLNRVPPGALAKRPRRLLFARADVERLKPKQP